MFVQPAVVGDRVYVGSCAGSYYALDVESGEVVWEHDFTEYSEHATFHGDPLITDELLITGSDAMDTPETRALDLATGGLVWSQTDDLAFSNCDVVSFGTLAVGRNTYGDLVAVDAADGGFEFKASAGAEVHRFDTSEAPLVVDDTVWLTTLDGRLSALGRDARERWSVDLGCDVSTSVAHVAGDTYVGCAEGRLVRVSGNQIAGEIDLDAQLTGRLLVTRGAVVASGLWTWIGAVTRDLKAVVWERTDLDTLSVVKPILFDGAVLTGGRDILYALEPTSGRTLWSAPITGKARGLGEADGVLFVGTIEGVIHAFRARPDAGSSQ